MSIAEQLMRKGKPLIAPAANPVEELRIESAVLRKEVAVLAGQNIDMRYQLKALEKEVAALRTLVTQLPEREPTVTKPGNALSPAEKQRAYRARLKAKKESTHA